MRIQTYERRLGINPANIPAAAPNIDNGDYGAAAAGNIQELALRMQKLQDDTEDARTLELFNKFKQDTMNYHDNPDTGVRNTRLGYMASGLYQDADTWMRSKGEEYVQNLKSNRAKRNFRKMAGDFIVQQSDSNSRFEAQQMKHYQTEQADASIKNSLNYIEAHYNDPVIIERERFSIRQALELKMRGSGIQAFNDAYAKIEDQIGVARIRQAYAVHPLNALVMMQDPDIHLLPETQAKLREFLKGKTEVYRLQAIAQAYSQYYTPENAEAASQDLLQRYGADEGKKAFTALQHIWRIQEMQKNARENKINEFQKNNAENFIRRLNDPNAIQPTREEVLDAQRQNHINPTFAQSMLHAIDAREQNDQKKLKEYNERLIRIAVDSGVEFSREQAVQLYSQNIIGDATKNYIFESIDKRTQSEKQNLLEAQRINEENIYARIIRNDPNDKVTLEELNHSLESHFIRPEKHKSFSDYVKARDKLTALDEKQKRGREIIANAEKGVFDSPEEIERQYIAGEIPDNAYFRVTAERRRQDTQTAKSEQKKHEAELDVLADQLARIYYAGNTQGFIDYLRDNNIPLADREYLTGKYNQHISMQEKAANENKRIDEEIKKAKEEEYKALFDLYYAMASDPDKPVFQPYHELEALYLDKVFDRGQFDTLLHKEEEYHRKQLKSNEDLKKQTKAQNAQELFFAALNGHHKTLDELNDLVTGQKLDLSDARTLLSVKKQQDDARDKAERELWKDRMFDKAKELAEKFPTGKEQDAYEELNSYSRHERETIKKFYDDFMQEQRTAKQNQDKEKAIRQENNFNSFHDYWDKGEPVPQKILTQMRTAGDISESQYTRAMSNNEGLYDRKGKESWLRGNVEGFDSMSPIEQERLIMQAMGVNEEMHKQSFDYLYKKVIDGTATDALIDWYFAHGRITPYDKENLKEYDSKFDKAQKELLRQLANQLRIDVGNMGIKKDSRLYEMLAINQFYEDTRLLDTHAKNFNEAALQYYQQAKQTVAQELAKRFALTQSSWFSGEYPTPLGERVNSVFNSNPSLQVINPSIPYTDLYGNEQSMNVSGDVVPFNNVVDITPPQQPVAPPPEQPTYFGYPSTVDEFYFPRSLPMGNNSGNSNSNGLVNQSRQPAPTQNQTSQTNQNNGNYLQGFVDITQYVLQGMPHHVTDGYYAAGKAYRQGRSHFATDIRAPVGTPIQAPMSADNWVVTSTGYNSKAGNKVSIATTNYKGDNVELTFAHLDSIDVKKGDTVTSGDVFARSGNTGNTTGPHVHISAKVNGRTVNPQNIDWGNPSADVQPYRQTQNNSALPQPNVEPFTPLVSSDAEVERAALDILGLDVNPLWGDISGDIASPNPYGFGGFLNAGY